MGNISKYLDDVEVRCPDCGLNNMQQETLTKFDEIREYLGRPLKITSGSRCSTHNFAVGGKADSEHLYGFALDLQCNNSSDRYELVQAMMTKGVRRIGVYKDKLTVHMGCGGTPWPQYVLWVL